MSYLLVASQGCQLIQILDWVRDQCKESQERCYVTGRFGFGFERMKDTQREEDEMIAFLSFSLSQSLVVAEEKGREELEKG